LIVEEEASVAVQDEVTRDWKSMMLVQTCIALDPQKWKRRRELTAGPPLAALLQQIETELH
jgi:hypothetical protein